jgi:outer membrane protein OmpA-like peptidoglycan-associated protein
MRSLLVPLAAVLVLAAAGCGGHAQSEGGASPLASSEASSAPSAAPESSASALAASATPEATPTPGVTPTPEPTPTPDLNLLSWTNGAVVRAYPQPLASAGQDVNRIAEKGVSYPTGAAGPFVYVFELPGPAAITGFTADLPQAEPSTAPANVTFAVSNTSATSGFTNVGTITAIASPGPQSLPASVTGRWIQITNNGSGFNGVGALGTVAPLPTAASLSGGIYVEVDSMPGKDGAFNPVPSDSSPWYRRFTTFGDGTTAVRCFDGHLGDAYPGQLDGRVWTFHDDKQLGRAFVNDDASLIVGEFDGSPMYLARTDKRPKFCTQFTTNTGSGPHGVLVLDGGSSGFWPLDQNALPGYSYERKNAGFLDATALAGKELVILNGVCDSSRFLSKGQGDGLLQWVSDGHKLLIIDADECSKSVYDFIPYQFTTSNPGARGASGKRLIIVENDSLGSNDKTDTAHYLDTQAWVNDTNNQLGDANTVTSTDPHWCGHLFGTNADNVNGFMEMYAQHGKGTIIYAGFDTDDSTKPPYDRLRTLEFLLPVPNDLACTQKVAGGFVIQPSQEGTFTAGTAATQTFSMELLANQGWKGHVTATTTGDFPATVTPNDFDVSGGTEPLKVAVSIPASAKPGAYTVTVTGDSGAGGTTASASITFTGTAPIKKAVIQKHQRIRIYGIHFDYDSAHIQPRSEPVIADIAALMKANPTWHFEVSGHTDSDGGAAYNLNLSQRRAQSVVNDLVSRYHIARSRLVAKGYGLTRPVASNATDAGKALNRRVELERLQ